MGIRKIFHKVQLSGNLLDKSFNVLKAGGSPLILVNRIKKSSQFLTQKSKKSYLSIVSSLKKSQHVLKDSFSDLNVSLHDIDYHISSIPPSNNKIIWFCFTIFLWFGLSCAYSYVEYLKSISFSNILGLLLAVVSLILVGMLFYVLFNDFLGVITVRKHIKSKEYIRQLLHNDEFEKLKNYLLSGVVIETSNKSLLIKKFADAQNSKELLSIYEEVELKASDKQVNAIINKYSLIASTAAIKDGFFNFLIMTIVFSKMLIDISKEYKIKLGICSFMHVMMMGLIGNSISSVLSNVLGATFKQIPYLNVIVEIGTPIAMMKALGCKVKYAIRPLEPFNKKMLNTTIRDIGKGLKND